MIVMSKIIEYFHEYCDSDGPTTYPGFLKFLARTKKFNPSMLSELKRAFIDDIEALKYIKTVCEGYIVDDAIRGAISVTMSQFILKHKHGYVDKSSEDSEAPSSDTQIVLYKDA